MENAPSSQQLKQLQYHKNDTDLIDDNVVQDFHSFHCHDTYNNYTFQVARKKGTTFINPSARNDSLVELKVGVLLPFHQNNNGWTRVMTMSGISAIRLAVAEINAQNLIPGAYITLVEKDSYPKAVEGQAAITQAVFSAISLIQEGVIGVIGDISSSWTSLSALMTSTLQIPQCSYSAIATSLSDKSQFGYFFRTAPTNLLYSDAVITFIISQGWPQIGVLYSNDDFGQQLSENVVMKARIHGIHVKSYQSFYEDGPKSDIKKSLDTFAATGVRVIFVAAEGTAQLAALTVAAHSGYINDNTVWITIDADTDTLFAAVNDYNSILARRKNNTDIVPSIYQTAFVNELSANSTKANRALKKQSLIDLIDPVEYAARTTDDFKPIDFNATFSGGVFTFDILKELPGYPPFDTFLDKWAHLDPAIYPYGGQNNISSNEGLAYSCMMVMASGFNQTLYNTSLQSSNKTELLQKLATGQLGQYLTPSTFNTSFVGPEGPVVFDQNGDISSGNFKLYNIQNGSQIEIGRIIAGDMNLTSLPVYHDGTTKVPTGVPDRLYLNPGYSSPVTITLLVIASLGAFIALLSMVVVLVYRKREVFKASSPLFCVLELIGFLLAYISLFFFVGYRTKLSCTLIPITFHLGYSLILGNLIAKNYRIYRIFNNIFITRTVVTDVQLLKVSGSIFATTCTILIAWFASGKVSTVNVPVSRSAYYTDCAFEGGPGHTVFVSLLTLFGSFQLMFATFLAFKTRSVGRNYSKYSEYKQIGLSVYNIFFSVLIGFIIFFVPTTDYYTRHYLTATMIVWATTFSLLTLFVPKLHAFFFPDKDDSSSHIGKASDLSGRQRNRNNAIGIVDNKSASSDSPSTRFEFDTNEDADLMSLNYMVNNSLHPLNDSKVKLNNISRKGRMQGIMMEVHETEVPVQQVFKYFPFLAAWEMMSIVLMPGISYFSFFSEKSSRGKVFAYSGSSIERSRPNEYILKIHGIGMSNVLMQVESEKDLIKWNYWFNTRVQSSPPTTNLSISTTPSRHEGGDYSNSSPQSTKFEPLKDNEEHAKRSAKRLTRQSRLDSGITTHHLLAGEEDEEYDEDEDADRRGSEMTDETLDSCYYQPVLSNAEYGISQIITARGAQAHQQQAMSNTDQEQNALGRSSFYSSFADYFTPPPVANTDSETTVVAPENDTKNM
ncbi:hypothetical protein HMPREF1544_04481 [Mucor circinelloides 1006PhL]|uniref:G-protein coupled receptors family 3 profile domain-containing protein n=1 Tax=Mucor circinelloides f. circinelloides (strain 1006PhL) TaxID=1220926 RepID=S2JJP9_MUCC1|nr:hypothetical protein HMPREF1544_04481 [Mucor circinelloides 1006PhL]